MHARKSMYSRQRGIDLGGVLLAKFGLEVAWIVLTILLLAPALPIDALCCFQRSFYLSSGGKFHHEGVARRG